MDHDHREHGDVARLGAIPGYRVTQGRRGCSARVGRALAVRTVDGLEVQLTCLDPVPPGGSAAFAGSASGERGMVLAAQISRIRDEHIIRIHDVLPLTDEATGHDRLVLATAMAQGGSLTSHLRHLGALSLGQAITLVVPIGEALQQVHLAGVVHAGLTSEAVLFARDGKPLLADIAIAQITGEPPTARPGFEGCVAPEVAEGYEPSVESDVYAFAALVWHMLAGEPPAWIGGRADLEDVAYDLPEPIRDILGRALAAEPDARPEVSEIVAQFHAAGPAEPIGVDTDRARDVPTRIRAMAARHPTSHRAPARRPPRAAVAVVAALCLVAVIAAVLFVPGLRGSSGNAAEGTDMLTVGSKGADPDHRDFVKALENGLSVIVNARDDAASTERSTDEARREAEAKTSTTDQSQPGREIIQTVLRARADAWESGDPGRLSQALAADSEALATDRADLLAATDNGAQFRDVEFVAQDIEITGVVPTGRQGIAAADQFSAQVVIARGPLRVLTVGDKPQIVEPSSEVVQLTLRRGPEGWRLWSWDGEDT